MVANQQGVPRVGISKTNYKNFYIYYLDKQFRFACTCNYRIIKHDQQHYPIIQTKEEDLSETEEYKAGKTALEEAKAVMPSSQKVCSGIHKQDRNRTVQL